MPEFLLEFYVARSAADSVADSAQRAGVAAAQLRRGGARVRYVRSIFVPEDETCFLVYDAGSADDVSRAAHLAGLPEGRIVSAVEADAPVNRRRPGLNR